MPGHYHAAPAGAFGKKRPLEIITDPQAACIWAPLNAGTRALAKAEHEMHLHGLDVFTIKFVSPKTLMSIRESYKIMGRNVSGPIDRLMGALARANERM